MELHVRLPELDPDDARDIVSDADRVCPYSNAVRNNVTVRVTVDPALDVI